MAASVLQVLVTADEPVAIGDTLLLMESMKMEIPVLAECEGEVAAVLVEAGDVVQEGDVLLTLRPR